MGSVLIILQMSNQIFDDSMIDAPTTGHLTEFGLLPDLPDEILMIILRKWLVTAGPITNPWLQNPSDSNGPQLTYGWASELNMAILRSSKRLHELGTRVLYGENVFRFTAEVTTMPNSPNLGTYVHGFLTRRIHSEFFSQSPTIVSTAEMVKNVLIQYSDNDSDNFARHGYAKDNANEPAPDHLDLEFQLSVLRRIQNLPLDLRRLTVTFDEEAKDILQYLEKKSAVPSTQWIQPDYNLDPRFFALTGSEVSSRIAGWKAFRDVKEPAIDSNNISHAGMKVKVLTARGTDEPLDNFRRARSNQGLVGDAIKQWFSSTNILVTSWNFSGRFICRNVQDDGTLIEPLDAIDPPEDRSIPGCRHGSLMRGMSRRAQSSSRDRNPQTGRFSS